MYLGQIRYGFATNSSSSHSVVLANHIQDDSDVPEGFGYGWDHFVLASEEAKRDYIFVACRRNFEETEHWHEFVSLVRPSEALLDGGGYVDHQSADLARVATIEHLKELLELLLKPRITILGGNDNTDYDFDIPGVYFEPAQLVSMKHRREARGDVYFDRNRGTKIHLFDQPINFNSYIASAPELVDIKVTDWCDIACRFCYQDSTKKGQHAPFEALDRTLKDLAVAGVFEVALGGGEPMSHPDFARILKRCNELDIRPNFTTKNYKGLSTPEFSAYAEQCGSIGISIATPEDVIQLLSVTPSADPYKLSLQIAMGAQTPEEFSEMLRLLEDTDAFSGLILLGYKNTGRGPRAKGNFWYEDDRLDGADPIEKFKAFTQNRRQKSRWGVRMSLSMDTEMVRSCKGSLAKHLVDPRLYMENEGRVSCYIDAVSMTVAPSSYCDKSLYRDYNFNIREIWPEMSENYYDLTKN